MDALRFIFKLTTLLGALFSVVANKLFPLFQDENFAPGVAGVIILFALIVAGKFLFSRFFPAFGELKACQNRLNAFKNKEDFVNGFDEFSAFIAKKTKLLRHSWQKFSETIIFPDDQEHHPLWITVRPSVFLNIEDGEHRLGLKWLRTWANILVGVGLLFTFLGLVAALHFAASAINNAVGSKGATAGMQDALVNLLKTATFKFWTSIAGLGSSICVTILHRWAAESLGKRWSAICDKIESLTQIVTPEFIANLQYRETRELTVQIKDFNGQLAFNIGTALKDALGSAMPPVMSEAMTPVAEQLTNLAGNISEMNQSALQSLTQEFGKVVTENAGTELRGLSATLVQLQETLTTTAGVVNGNGTEMSRQLSEATTELRGVMSSLVEGINRLGQGIQADVSSSQQALQDQLGRVGEELGLVADSIRISLSDMGNQLTTTSGNAAEAFSRQIADSVTRIEASTVTNASAMESLVGSMRAATNDATGSLANEMAGISRGILEMVERMAASIDSATRQMQERSSESAGSISSTLLVSVQKLQDAAEKNASQISRAVEAMVGASDTARTGVDESARQVALTLNQKGREAAGHLISGADSVLTVFTSAINDLQARVDNLAEALSSTERKVMSYVAAMEEVNTSARSAASAMSGTAKSLTGATTPLSQAEQSLSRTSQALNQSVERLLGGMQPVQQEMLKASSDLRLTFGELRSIWSRHEERFKDVDATLGRTIDTIIRNLDGNAAGLNDYVVKMDGHFTETVQYLAGNIRDLKDVAEMLEDSVRSLRGPTVSSRKV